MKKSGAQLILHLILNLLGPLYVDMLICGYKEKSLLFLFFTFMSVVYKEKRLSNRLTFVHSPYDYSRGKNLRF